MSSTIFHVDGPVGEGLATATARETDDTGTMGAGELAKNQFLVALGDRVKALRARRGMTRRTLAHAADVSERHLANMEYGVGNASILVLLNVAGALQCTLAELVGDVTTTSPEWLLIRELLEGQSDTTLKNVRVSIAQMLGTGSAAANSERRSRIALVGLRGAGKSTLGRMLADHLGYAFVEVSREIEKLAGCSTSEIQALYGQSAYRRYERRAIEETIQIYPESVISTPGGMVSDAATFNTLLAHCTTVWLQADAEDHMSRVLAQGDMRPMAASHEAMDDLRGILAGRAAFYAKADHTVNTSAQDLAATFEALKSVLGSPRDDA